MQRRLLLVVLAGWTATGIGAASPFGSYRPATPERSGDVEILSQYVTMDDGVDIAVDVMLPPNRKEGERFPALLYQTSFWRNVDVRWPIRHFLPPDPWHAFFARHGYAVVLVDVRGTGASFGSRLYPWAPAERKDARVLVDWIVRQPWSDGRVGAYGKGYEGTAAELLATVGHPAVKAVMPMYSEFDTYLEIAFPGGIFNEWFVRSWSDITERMARNEIPDELGRVAQALARGVRPVAGRADRLPKALEEHRANLNLYDLARTVHGRDTVIQVGDNAGSIDDFTVFRHRTAVEASGVPVFAWGGWFDGASADSVLRRLHTYRNPVRGVIGPWSKGARENASPYASSSDPEPPLEAQYLEGLRFFDRHVRGLDTGDEPDRLLYYYTLGEERWKVARSWPPPGVTLPLYLAEGDALSTTPPNAPMGADRYRVDFSASTGPHNRWHGHLLGQPVVYPDRAEADARLLTYTGPPLEADTELTGHPVAVLHVSSTASDGAFYVYLEEVAPDGKVTYLTEGQLRARFRRESDAEPLYRPAPVNRTFTEADAAPLTPGEVVALRIPLLPLSVRVPRGHRLRVALAGHDDGTFARVPAEGDPTVTVHRSADRPSRIELPVVIPENEDS